MAPTHMAPSPWKGGTLGRFGDGSFVAADTRLGNQSYMRLKKGNGGGLPSAMLVNPYYREAGEEPKLTDEALADVVRMREHAAAATLQERAAKKSYTKPPKLSVEKGTVSTVQCTPAHRYTSPCTT